MTNLKLGLRGVVGAALALPLTLAMIGAGGRLIFDPEVPFNAMNTPYWILVFYGLVNLALGVAIWIPYLHRLVGAVIVLDCAAIAAVDWSYGLTGSAKMHLILAAAGAAIALLWSSRRVDLREVKGFPQRGALA